MLLGWYFQYLRYFWCSVHIKSLESVYSALICARIMYLTLEHRQNNKRVNNTYVESNLEEGICMGFFSWKLLSIKDFVFFLNKRSTLQLLNAEIIYRVFYSHCGLYSQLPHSAMTTQHWSYLPMYRTLGSQMWMMLNMKLTLQASKSLSILL